MASAISFASGISGPFARPFCTCPTLPDSWTRGSVQGLAARGNVTVDITWEDGKITDYRIHGDRGHLNIVLCR